MMSETPPGSDDPTRHLYGALTDAFDHFNAELFGGQLPRPILTLGTAGPDLGGHFARGLWGANSRWKMRADEERVDEIALDMVLRDCRSDEEFLSMLVHEMVHAWQSHFGTRSLDRHNPEWRGKMLALGLEPVDMSKFYTDLPPGAGVGQKVLPGGHFDTAAVTLLASDFALDYARRPVECRIRFQCDQCGAVAEGSRGLKLLCADGAHAEPVVMTPWIVRARQKAKGR